MATAPPTLAGPLVEPLRTQARADTWFRLRSPWQVGPQLRDLARREIELASEGLWVSPGPALDAGVLYARSAVDKVRVVVELARAGQKKKTRRRLVARLDALAEGLATVRDPGTLEDVVERLRQGSREAVTRDALTVLRGRLAERRYRAGASRRSGASMAELRSELEALQSEVEAWGVDGEGFDVLAPGLRRLYRRGRKALKACRSDGVSRKRGRRLMTRARELAYALRLLEPAWPAPLAALGHELDRVAGRLHEADELHGLVRLARSDAEVLAALPADDLTELALRLRDRFRAEAVAVGQRVWADRPDAFRDRLDVWWRAWASESPPLTEN